METGTADILKLIHWTTTGADADVENGGPYTWSPPAPGQTDDSVGHLGGPSGLMIYDALVFNACGNLSSFPVEHESTATVSTVIGSFSDIDNSTTRQSIQQDIANLNYAVRATDSDGVFPIFTLTVKPTSLAPGSIHCSKI